MADYRRFTKEDWYEWAGAEKFREGKDPFIYNRELDGEDISLTIIADKNGIAIYINEDLEDPIGYYRNDNDRVWQSLVAETELIHLIAYLNKYTDAKDILFELEHPQDELVKGYQPY